MMKKTVLLLLLGALSSSLFAQSISFRNDNEKTLAVGTNFMITRSFGSYSTGVALAMYTDKVTKERSFDMGIYFETYGQTFCQEHSRAVLKTFSGTIVTLVQRLDAYKVQGSRERVGDYKSTTFSLKPQYLIQENDLNTLMNEGIQILRIETSKGFKDFTYKSDVLGGYLKSEYNLILEKRDFESNF